MQAVQGAACVEAGRERCITEEWVPAGLLRVAICTDRLQLVFPSPLFDTRPNQLRESEGASRLVVNPRCPLARRQAFIDSEHTS